MRSQAGLPYEYDAVCTVPNPLLRILEERLPGLQFGRQTRRTAVVAYGDDVTLFVISPADFPAIQDAMFL